jgi:predicted small metal-binding protein
VNKEMAMFQLRCRDVGFDCPGVVRGATKEDVLQQAAAHAAEVHGTTVSPELAAKVSGLIQAQPVDGPDSPAP